MANLVIAPQQTVTQQPNDSPVSEQPSSPAETSVIVPAEEGQISAKKPRKPRKTKVVREAEKQQVEAEAAEKSKQASAALAKDLTPLGSPPSTGKIQKQRDPSE